MNYIDYLKLSSKEKMLYKFHSFYRNLGHGFLNFFVNIWYGIIKFFKGIGRSFKEVGYAFVHGNIYTKLSFLFLGIGHIAAGQRLKGILIMLVEVLFIFYIVMIGSNALHSMVTLGNVESYFPCHYLVDGNWIEDANLFHFSDQATALSYCQLNHPGTEVQSARVFGDNSSVLLLFGVLAVFLCIGFFFFYLSTQKSAINLEERKQANLRNPSFFEDIKDYLDGKFYRILLALPLLGVFIFTILPLVDMILMAFTNYNNEHNFPRFFTWTGIENFLYLFASGKFSGNFGNTFINILGWTVVWAIFATFLNYFLGMFVAMLINKKGLKCKMIFRTLLVLSIAMPQFVSLLAFNRFFEMDGIIQGILQNLNIIGADEKLKILTTTGQARIFIILVNIWIGIPYTMLAVTGILMNVPADLYESAQIDGASPMITYAKITLPYVLFVTGPKLITDFIGNINNFNVMYFLTGGGPMTNDYLRAGKTDLLITWLYRLTVEDSNYSYASVIGIMIFAITATFSLIAYRHTSAFKNEENFA